MRGLRLCAATSRRRRPVRRGLRLRSMGGKVAAAVALLFPEMVASLGILDIAPVAYERGRAAGAGETTKYDEARRGGDEREWGSSRFRSVEL